MMSFLLVYAAFAIMQKLTSSTDANSLGRFALMDHRRAFLAQLRVSLSELDRWFEHLLEGRPYHGEAINPKNLSLFEKNKGVGKVCLLP